MSDNDLVLTGDPFKLWYKKTLFLAKRGNLESELLLVAYIDSLNEISIEKACLLEKLLDENDQNLFCWLMTFDPKAPHNAIIPPHKYRALINEIRTSYLN